MIPIYSSTPTALNVTFGDTVSVIENGLFLNHNEISIAVDSFTVEENTLTFFDRTGATDTITNSGASGLTGFPIEKVSAVDAFTISLGGTITGDETVSANDAIAGYIT